MALPDHGPRRADPSSPRCFDAPGDVLAKEITPCSPKVPAPCWTGEPYQPVPVPTNASDRRRPGRQRAPRGLPRRRGADDDAAALPGRHARRAGARLHRADHRGRQEGDPKLNDADTIGASGLEEQYDAQLRGVDGTQNVAAQPAGLRGAAPAHGHRARQGDTLVTSIDAQLQTAGRAVAGAADQADSRASRASRRRRAPSS